METLVAQLETYLQNALGDVSAITPWKEDRKLVLFLRDRYRFFEARILGKACLLMTDEGDQEESPATVRKHVDQVKIKWSGPVIFVRRRIAAYNRKRLIDQKLPFVAPGNQMYLPMLGVDFREQFPTPRPTRSGLRPSSQAVLIYAILRDDDHMSPTRLGAKLGYSAMAMSHVLNELEAAGIATSSAIGRGRDRRLRFDMPKQEAWKKALPLLRTPVKSRHTIRMIPNEILRGPRAGLSALAHYSMMAEPENPVMAVSRKDWKTLRTGNVITAAMSGESNGGVVEVWSYAPTPVAIDGWVDRLSLYLSLRDMQDERIQAALDQMMKEVLW